MRVFLVLPDQVGQSDGEVHVVVYVLVQVGDEDSLARRETLPVEEELQPRDTVQLAGGTQGRLTVKARITKENKALNLYLRMHMLK